MVVVVVVVVVGEFWYSMWRAGCQTLASFSTHFYLCSCGQRYLKMP
jgi:hypothetical protein